MLGWSQRLIKSFILPFDTKFLFGFPQFRRFQEVTLTRLHGIAENYNISYNIDARFHQVTDQQQELRESLNNSDQMTQRELSAIKIWLKKLQRTTKKLDLKMSSLEETMTERNKQVTKDNKIRDTNVSNLTSHFISQKRVMDQLVKDNSLLKKGMEMFREVVKRQGVRIATLEEQIRGATKNEILPPSSLVAPQELNRTPDNKPLVSPGNEPEAMALEHRMAKLRLKHDQRKKLQDEQQQQLIPGKSGVAPMASHRQNEIKNMSFPEGETHDIQTTGPSLSMTDKPFSIVETTLEKTSGMETTRRPPQQATKEEPPGIEATRTPHVTGNKPSSIHAPKLHITEGKSSVMHTTNPPPKVTEVPRHIEQRTKMPGTICNVDSMLSFPSSSTENYATFGKGLREALHEFSICSWVKTNASYIGTILSYATEDNDNKLVLYGRNGEAYDSLHFVIGDPAFRELPMVPLTDGNWHHVCFIWSSIQGKYWFYVDRRLSSTGSRFQKGYEIPPGGSLILGQEQDSLGGGFDSSESFVGHLAGFAVWNRALSPGEVSGIATGKGLPRGTILKLADASALHGLVQRVDCTCLEHCL
uniref:Pentraxin 4 n=1 Tax=Leptobrachium leishanense TaxID=445787 RepID=A0A8C5QM07_9ANUR